LEKAEPNGLSAVGLDLGLRLLGAERPRFAQTIEGVSALHANTDLLGT